MSDMTDPVAIDRERKGLLNKLLGPTAEYLGDRLQNYTRKRMETTDRIFENAETKLGDRINQPGQVPPKVLRIVLNDGSFNDDALAAEYFGGVLASSRTEVGRDDRGARMAKIVDGLSTYQLRFHYYFYTLVKEQFKGKNYNIGTEQNKMQLFIPAKDFFALMEFDQKEAGIFNSILGHVLLGLGNDGLLADDWSMGEEQFLKTEFSGASSAGLLATPSNFGFEFYLWAHGLGDKDISYFFNIQEQPTIPIVTAGVTPAYQGK